MSDDLLSVKELASAIGRNRTYVFAMKRKGFSMPGNRASIRQAISFLVRNPAPWSKPNKNEH